MKVKEIDFFQDLANERVEEKRQTLINNQILIDYMKKNKLKEINYTSLEQLEEENKRLIEYIKTATS